MVSDWFRFLLSLTVDYDDPSTGVTLSYTGGDNTWCQQERSLRLSFYCMNNYQSLPKDSIVIEYPQCVYNLQLESIYGCPVECGQVVTSCAEAAVCVDMIATVRRLVASATKDTTDRLARSRDRSRA